MWKIVGGTCLIPVALGVGVGGARAEVSSLSTTCTGTGQNVTASIVQSAFGWSGAKRDAAKRGGYLAVIKSAEVGTCIDSLLTEFLSFGTYWLGASDGNGPREGRWEWIDGTNFWNGDLNGAAVDGAFVAWSDTEPNDSGRGEDCMEWNGGASGSAKWNDANCRTAQFYVLMVDN